MGSVAVKECHKCNIRRPATCMRQVSVKVKSGTSGMSISFNPQRQKSARINSGRNYYRHVSKWECSTRWAHGNANYYKDLAKQEAKDKEIKELEDANKKEIKALDDIKKNEEVRVNNISVRLFSKYLADVKLKATNEFIGSDEYHVLDSEYGSVLEAYPENKCSNSLSPAVTIISKKLKFNGAEIGRIEESKLHKSLLIDFDGKTSRIGGFFRFVMWYLFVIPLLLVIVNTVLVEKLILSEGLASLLSLVAIIILIGSKIHSKKKKKISFKISQNVKYIVLKLRSLMHRAYVESFISFIESSDEDVEDIKYFVNKIKTNCSFFDVEDSESSKIIEPLDSKTGTAKKSPKTWARDMYEHDLFFDIACAKVAREMTLGNGIVSADEEQALLTFLGEKDIEDKALLDDILRANIPVLVVLKMVKSKYVDDESTLFDFLNNLFFIAESDGKVTENELKFIKKSANILGISSKEVDVKIKERLVGFTESQSGEYIITENYDVLEDVLDEQDWEENDSGF